MDVEVVTEGGGLLIIAESGASSCHIRHQKALELTPQPRVISGLVDNQINYSVRQSKHEPRMLVTVFI